MISTTKELINKGETQYSIKRKLLSGDLFLIERGIYSDEPNPYIDEAYLSAKYPNAVLTGLSAFNLYDLTDHVPESFYFATEQHSFPIRRKDVMQSYQESSFINVGVTTVKTNSGVIRIYDLERMLIELVRLKEKYPREVYYEVLNSFRNIKNQLDFHKLNNYMDKFTNRDTLASKIKELI